MPDLGTILDQFWINFGMIFYKFGAIFWCFLHAVSCELWVVSGVLWTVSCVLRAESCELSTVSCELWAVSCELNIWHPDIQISGYPDIQISGYRDMQISGYLDIRISACRRQGTSLFLETHTAKCIGQASWAGIICDMCSESLKAFSRRLLKDVKLHRYYSL